MYTPSEINFRARSKLSIKNPRVIKRLQRHYIFVRSRQCELASSFRCRKPAEFQRGKIVSPKLLPFPRILTLPEGWMQGAFSYTFSFYFRLKNNERKPMSRSVGKALALNIYVKETAFSRRFFACRDANIIAFIAVERVKNSYMVQRPVAVSFQVLVRQDAVPTFCARLRMDYRSVLTCYSNHDE